MRKQTKLVAVASAAALLAIGASMTSFAATGWVEEGGEWYYYNSDGSRAEDEWKKSGDKWFWLDSEENGAMAIDKLVEDDDNTYYVDSTGAMVSNTWVKVVNEDQDDEEDPAEYNYYYMQSNGKAYKAGDSGTTKFKTIDGKRYAFDEDGKMLYGWVNGSAERLTDDSEWASVGMDEDVYYLGNWDDGAMKTGWQYLYVYDEEEDEDMYHWFWFNSNGTRFQKNSDTKDNYRTKKVNGKRYGFDERGVMVYTWVDQLASGSTTTASASAWQYFNSPEDGARITKGWFKVIPPNEDNTFNAALNNSDSFDTKDADDEDENWYYADGDGKLYSGAIKKIKGKYYAFAPDDGREGASKMLSGLVLLDVGADGTINDVIDDGVDSDELSDLLDGDKYASDLAKGATLYYFGDDADSDGAMKTGSVTVNLDGDSYQFSFSKSGGTESRGAGLTGIDDNKYIYKAGCRIKAGSDDKYQVVEVLAGTDGGVDTGSDGVQINKIGLSDLRNDAQYSDVQDSFRNDDSETLRFVIPYTNGYYLVNTSGNIQKNKSAAKDGDEWYFYVDDYAIKLYANSKELTPDKNVTDPYNLDDWKDWTIDKDGNVVYKK